MGGRKSTGIDALWWARRAEELGAGEVLLNSMDADGTQQGFDLEMIKAVRKEVKIPIIASGGAGKASDFPPEAQERHRISRLPSPPARTPYLPHQSSTTARLQSARSRTSCAVLAMPCAREAEGMPWMLPGHQLNERLQHWSRHEL